MTADARLAECARPRAQQAPNNPTEPISLQLHYFSTLLRPRTGALRQDMSPLPLTHYHAGCSAQREETGKPSGIREIGCWWRNSKAEHWTAPA